MKNILIGSLRGAYVGKLRYEAFKEKYGREPIWLEARPRTEKGIGLDDDFVLASRLVNAEEAYIEFDKLMREQLDYLKEEDFRRKNRKMVDDSIADNNFYFARKRARTMKDGYQF